MSSAPEYSRHEEKRAMAAQSGITYTLQRRLLAAWRQQRKASIERCQLALILARSNDHLLDDIGAMRAEPWMTCIERKTPPAFTDGV